MKAVILAGGYGTRLRPLTLTKPKPLVEFCNKPILFHQVEALMLVGVDAIILAVSYMCDMLKSQLDQFAHEKNITIIYSKEDEPLGTAGPLALARKYLENGDEPFFVLNSDIICEYPLEQMLNFHKLSHAEGTIAVTKVDDPSKYGVVVYHKDGKVARFVEKPIDYISNKINAGIYILQPSVLNRIQLRPMSIEKEVFPFIAKNGSLFAYDMAGFWMDIGQPKDFLIGSNLYINHLKSNFPKMLGDSTGLYPSSIIHPSCVIGIGCKLEDCIVGEDVVLGEGVYLRESVIFSKSVIKSHSYIERSIIGWNCSIGKWVRIEGYTIMGENVNVKDQTYINGAKILPHKSIINSYFTPEVIM